MVRIRVDHKYIQGAKKNIERRKTPRDFQTETRPLSPTVSKDIATISKDKPQELKLYPDTPTAELYSPAFDQKGGNLATLLALLPRGEGREIVKAVIQEQKLLGAPANA